MTKILELYSDVNITKIGSNVYKNNGNVKIETKVVWHMHSVQQNSAFFYPKFIVENDLFSRSRYYLSLQNWLLQFRGSAQLERNKKSNC